MDDEEINGRKIGLMDGVKGTPGWKLIANLFFWEGGREGIGTKTREHATEG
jgi:hypothetical protein